jgi:predicted kinase
MTESKHRKIIILKGPSCSGKSTFAEEMIQKGNNWARVSKDSIRKSLFPFKYISSNKLENRLNDVQHSMLSAALNSGHNVIIDNTNLRTKDLNLLFDSIDLLKHFYSIDVILKDDFCNVSLKNLLKRNDNREKSLPPEIIKKQCKKMKNDWQEYYKTFAERMTSNIYSYDNVFDYHNDKKTAIFDMDGTLALMNGRSPYEYHKCDTDLVNEKVAYMFRLLRRDGWHLVIFTGREDSCRQKTKSWLVENDLSPDLLFMRKTRDRRPDSIVKKEMLNQVEKKGLDAIMAFDDRDSVIKLWRQNGIIAYQVNYGNF